MHIYHSALELCPVLSTVRKLYYHSNYDIIHLPRLVAGAPGDWDRNVSISGKDYVNGSCAWSSCGRLVAIKTRRVIEIRNRLTFELLTTLRPPKATPLPMGSFAYSPDGRSLACASDTAILIWDTQTGGVAREIEWDTNIDCEVDHVSLVWLLDGRICATSFRDGVQSIHAYNFTTGSGLSLIMEFESWVDVGIWGYGGSLFITRAQKEPGGVLINIFEFESTPIKVHSFSVALDEGNFQQITFSPATHHISIATNKTLFIFNCWNTSCVLEAHGDFSPLSSAFSSDGSLFAASEEGVIHFWMFTNCYIPWKEFYCTPQSTADLLQFPLSPTPTSILARFGNVLQVWHLQDLPTGVPSSCGEFSALSHSGNHIATSAYGPARTITIINLHSPTTSQFLYTGVNILGLALTGNVLVVVSLDRVMAWRFLEEGLLDGTICRSDILWNISLPQWLPHELKLLVGTQFGMIRLSGDENFTYDIETGEAAPEGTFLELCGSNSHTFGFFKDYIPNHIPSLFVTPEGGWQQSQSTFQEEWIRDPEGRHRLWVPIEWRENLVFQRWCHKATTLFATDRIFQRNIIITF